MSVDAPTWLVNSLRVTDVTATADAATTLTAASNSDCTVYCPQSTTNNDATHNAIILPAPTAGMRVKVIFKSTGDNTGAHGWQITSTGANMLGTSVGVAGGLVATLHGASTNLIRSGTAADTKAGDWVQLNSDGTNWYFYATSTGTANPYSVS